MIQKPKRWNEILHFHQHPEEHPGDDYCCDTGEESEVVLWAAQAEAERDALQREIDLRVEQGKALNEDKERFKAENERLKAPVSDEEMQKYSVRVYNEAGQHGWLLQRSDVDTLIASRAQATKGAQPEDEEEVECQGCARKVDHYCWSRGGEFWAGHSSKGALEEQ